MELPDWESKLVEDAVRGAEDRLEEDGAKDRAETRAIQLAREQAYHRLAVAIDRPRGAKRQKGSGQLSFFPTDPTLFPEDTA
jgi:hypothetical protein